MDRHDRTTGPPQIHLRGQDRCKLGCAEPARVDGTLCWTHHDEIRDMLDPANEGDRDTQKAASIPVYYNRLDPTPGVSGSQDRRAPGFHSTPPLQLQPVVLRDPRSRPYPVIDVWYPARPGDGQPDLDKPMYENDGEPRPTGYALSALAVALWEHLELHGPTLPDGAITAPGVTAQAEWLLAHIDDISAHPDADDIYRDLAELRDQLRNTTGDPRDHPVGYCIALVKQLGSDEQYYCDHPLYLPPPQPGVEIHPDEPVLHCRRCNRRYLGRDLIRLRLANEQAS